MKRKRKPSPRERPEAGAPVFLGVIPARGGSKGLPGKNVRLLAGVPLISHAVREALKSRRLTDFLVSTDDPRIAAVARRAGAPAPFLRPRAMAGDRTPVWPAVRHAVAFWEKTSGRPVRAVVLLQPTSPLRTAKDIDDCVRVWERTGADACVTAAEAHDSPYFNMVEPSGGRSPWVRSCAGRAGGPGRRQDAPPVYALNGAVYVVGRAALRGLDHVFRLRKVAVSPMPRERSVDVDTEDDLALAEFRLARQRRS